LSFQRKQFKFTLPIREIQESDADQEFTNELQPKNDVDLAYLVENNHGRRHVIVHDIDGKVMAFLTFIDRDDHFHLDLVETNRIHPESAQLNPGIALILTLEGMSRTFGFNRITLHSTPERIPLYQDRLGYVITGEAVYNSDYDMMLTPMTKSFT
jgi:hypothetical protein